MPRAAMDKLQIMRANALGDRHQYAVDGPPVAYMEDTNANGTIDVGEKAYLIFGMRRGGQALYALDVSNPESPELLWVIDKSTTGYSELGYTFGAPRIIMTDEGGTLRPAVAFSGGYDLNKDDRSGVGTDDSEGNAIYIAEIDSGDLIWKAVGSGTSSSSVFLNAALVDSIAAPLSILDSDGDGDHDRFYVGDTGGNVWRADIEGANKSNWKLTLLARLGRHSVASPTKVDDRRFFHRADIVQSLVDGQMFDSVLLGSGDRADPLDAAGVTENYAYMIKDYRTLAGAGMDSTLVHSDAGLGDVSNTCLEPGSPCLVDLTRGWKMNLSANGEKQLSKPVTILSTTFFTTYIPGDDTSEGSCTPSEGSGRLYAVSLLNGSAKKNYDTTTSELERFTELKSSGIPAEVVPIPEDLILRPDGDFEDVGGTARIETFWFEQEDSDL
jgi:type IV pilus assembly protein PilY1